MIPSFDKNGLLPAGIHTTTWKEFYKHYSTTPYRKELLSGLQAALKVLVKAGCAKVWIDGSFVTAKETPGDFDACWDTTGVDIDTLYILDPVLLQFENKRAAQKAKYGGEFFPAQLPAESAPPYRIFLEFFQTDKTTGNAKGIIQLDIRRWKR